MGILSFDSIAGLPGVGFQRAYKPKEKVEGLDRETAKSSIADQEFSTADGTRGSESVRPSGRTAAEDRYAGFDSGSTIRTWNYRSASERDDRVGEFEFSIERRVSDGAKATVL